MISNKSIKGKFFGEPYTFFVTAIAAAPLLICHETVFGDKALAQKIQLESLLQEV